MTGPRADRRTNSLFRGAVTAALILLATGAATAADRVVLGEYFTNLF